MSCVLPIPEFRIHLFGPTSTTKQIEVSVNFADDDGMIITFENNTHSSSACAFFQCPWISKYPDEDERLFVHGKRPLVVKAVRLIESNKIFTNEFAAMYVFNTMFQNGIAFNQLVNFTTSHTINMAVIDRLLFNEGILSKLPITAQEYQSINELTKAGYSYQEAVNAITLSTCNVDPYIISMFRIHINQIKSIWFNIVDLLNYTEFGFYSLIMDGVERPRAYTNKVIAEANVIIDSKINLISPRLFQLFPKLKSITIDTTTTSHESYPFNLLYFLQNISVSTKWNKITISSISVTGAKTWISNVWNGSFSVRLIKEQYQKKGLRIEFLTYRLCEERFYRVETRFVNAKTRQDVLEITRCK